MARNDNTSAIVDGILEFIAVSGTIAVGFAMPGTLVALNKPLNKYLKHLDKKAREREMRRIFSYMKSTGLVTEDYQHGITLTKHGQKRLDELSFKNLAIPEVQQWDHVWRIVFYDIPEKLKPQRNALKRKLRELGFIQLQRSVWVHAFPCRQIVTKITLHYRVNHYVSYIEASHIDNEGVLITRFKNKYSKTNFK
jgi:DNA-binding transcriptional regulator PaaX